MKIIQGKGGKGRRTSISLRTQVLGILVATILPVVVCLFAASLLMGQETRSQIFRSSRDALLMNLSVFDTELETAVSVVRQLDKDENYVLNFESDDVNARYYAANEYKERMETPLSVTNFIGGYGAYTAENGQLIYLSESAEHSVSFDSRWKLLRAVREDPETVFGVGEKWKSILLDGDWYLVYGYRLRNTWFFSWIEVAYLSKVTSGWSVTEDGAVYLLSRDREIMAESTSLSGIELRESSQDFYTSGKNNQYLIFDEPAENGALLIAEAVNIRALTRSTRMITYAAVGCLAIFGCLIPILLRSLQKSVFGPMDQIQYAIGRVNRGVLDYRIPPGGGNTEFQNLFESFNGMVSQIQNLKIRTYEDEIEKAKMQMQYMQVQIEPHFYLNALNTINAMAQFGDTALIGQLTRALSDYMRFITKSGDTVTVAEELAHIGNYMTVMKIRMGDTFRYTVEAEPALQDFRIPPLVIQTLVENVMKYAFNVYENTEIRIRIRSHRLSGRSGVEIVVTDNGKGYPPDYIEKFNRQDYRDRTKIGLQNARQRLYYLYGKETVFRIGNRPEGGAQTEIWIPHSGRGGHQPENGKGE